MGAARRFVRDGHPTDELEQVVLEAIWRVSLRPRPKYLRHYLVACVRNALITRVRRGKRSIAAEPLDALDEPEHAASYADRGFDRVAARDELELHLGRLSRRRSPSARAESFPRRKIRTELRRPFDRPPEWM